MMCLFVCIDFFILYMNRSPISAQNMNGYDYRIEENF